MRQQEQGNANHWESERSKRWPLFKSWSDIDWDRKWMWRRWLADILMVMTVVAACSCSVALSAGEYTLQIIAQDGDIIDGREILGFAVDPTNVAINNDREVAFFAGVRWHGITDWSVMTQRRFLAGAGKIVDGQVPYFDSEDHWVDINNRGEVAYTGILPTRDRGVFINEQMVVAPGDVIDGYTLERIGEQARINDLGTVVFETGREGRGNAISSQHHIVFEAGLVDDGVRVTGVAWPHINNGGDIAVIANIRQLDSSGIANQEEILFKKGDVIDGLTVFKVRGFGGITDDGEVVAHLHLVLDENNDVGTMIATQNRVLFRDDDLVAGMRVAGVNSSNVILNNHGEVAFLGAIMEDGQFVKNVLFAGDRAVVADGDVLGGKVIREVYPNFDMNDRGDVAFRVRFEDFSDAVVLATIPEPTGCVIGIVLLVGAAGSCRTNPRSSAPVRLKLK